MIFHPCGMLHKYCFTPRHYCIPKVCNNRQNFCVHICDFVSFIQSNHTPVGNEAEALPNLMKPNQSTQVASLYIWQKGFGWWFVDFDPIVTYYYYVLWVDGVKSCKNN